MLVQVKPAIVYLKSGLVYPVLLLYPLQLLFIGAVKGVRDEPLPKQIGEVIPRDLRGQLIRISYFSESPVLKQRRSLHSCGCRRGHLLLIVRVRHVVLE